jgi:hypothetical protein
LALTWFIRYIYDWNLQFLNNVIILKLRFSPSDIGDLSRFWLSCLGPLFYCSQIFKLFGFPNFRSWAYLMKVILETCHAH